MKQERYQQFLTVKAEAPELFTEDLNRAIRDLRGKSPVVHFSETDPLCAYVSYTERFQTPESLGEEYEMQGIRFTCEMCPMFTPIMKRNGTPDARLRYGDCPESEFGRTYKDSPACDKLYKMLKAGRVKLVRTDEEEDTEKDEAAEGEVILVGKNNIGEYFKIKGEKK